MQSDQPVALQTTYDSADAALQWRCNLHYILKPPVFITFAVLATAPTLILHLSLLHFFAIFAIFVGLSMGEIAISAKRRSRSPRICTTTINANGVHDLTPDGGITHAWREIVKIEQKNGDLFFFTNTGGLFVPRSAFASIKEASEFHRTAENLWQAGRKPLLPHTDPGATGKLAAGADREKDKGIPKLSNDDKLAELLAEDEAVWEALEKEHKKQRENQNNS